MSKKNKYSNKLAITGIITFILLIVVLLKATGLNYINEVVVTPYDQKIITVTEADYYSLEMELFDEELKYDLSYSGYYNYIDVYHTEFQGTRHDIGEYKIRLKNLDTEQVYQFGEYAGLDDPEDFYYTRVGQVYLKQGEYEVYYDVEIGVHLSFKLSSQSEVTGDIGTLTIFIILFVISFSLSVYFYLKMKGKLNNTPEKKEAKERIRTDRKLIKQDGYDTVGDNGRKNYGIRYLFAFIIIGVSILGYYLVSTPHEEIIIKDEYYWNHEDGIYGDFSDEELNIYVGDPRVDSYILYNSNEIRFTDDEANPLYILSFDNLTDDAVFPTFRYIPLNTSPRYEDFRKMFEVDLPEGTYKIDLVALNYDFEQPPLLTMNSEPEIITYDYTEYMIIPIICGMLGFFFLIITFFAGRDNYGKDPYSNDHHEKKRRKKRERY